MRWTPLSVSTIPEICPTCKKSEEVKKITKWDWQLGDDNHEAFVCVAEHPLRWKQPYTLHTSRANVASSKGFCIAPRSKVPRSPPCAKEPQSERSSHSAWKFAGVALAWYVLSSSIASALVWFVGCPVLHKRHNQSQKAIIKKAKALERSNHVIVKVIDLSMLL